MEENQSIIPLAEKWEEFVRQKKGGSVEQFAAWVLQGAETPKEKTDVPDWNSFADPVLKGMEFQGDYPNIPDGSGLAGYMVVRLFKAIRFYFKPVLQKHELSSIDDLFFLATLAWKKDVNKKALCQINMTDIPTGMDIIKRLIKQGLIAEREGPNDKREKRMTLTDKGNRKVFEVFSDDLHVQDVMADLPIEERKSLLKVLDRLNCFHTKVYNKGGA
jgi:DNA-binding MarR family transcriptional regulator